MTKLLHWTTADWFVLMAQVVAVASGVRVGLHWLRKVPLLQLIPEQSLFWNIYSALEATAAYVALSLSALGAKKPESTLAEPVVSGQSPSEGQIIAEDATTKPLAKTER